MSEDGKNFIQSISKSGQDYVQLKLDYYKIQGIEKGSRTVAVSVSSVLIGVVALMVYFWAMFALMYLLEEKVFDGSIFKSSFAIFLGHFFLLLILYLFKGTIERKISDKIALKGLRKINSLKR